MQNCPSGYPIRNHYINPSCPRSHYVLGLDSTVGTYATDYVVAIFCLYCAEVFRRISNKYTSLRPGGAFQQDVRKNTSTVNRRQEELLLWARTHHRAHRNVANAFTGMLVACAVMHLLAGIAHNLVNFVRVAKMEYNASEEIRPDEFACVVAQVLPLYFLWQATKLFATTFSLFLVLTSFYAMLCKATQSQDHFDKAEAASTSDEVEIDTIRVRSYVRQIFDFVKRHNDILETILLVNLCVLCLFHICVTALATIQLIYTDEREVTYQEIEDIWTLETTTYVIAACLFIFMSVSLLLLSDELQIQNAAANAEGGADNSRCELISVTTNGYENSPENSFAYAHRTAKDTSDNCRINAEKHKICLMRCAGVAIMIIAGLLQYFLSFRCGPHATSNVHCPLPPEFNHNAAYHSLFLSGILILCFSEYQNLAQELQLLRKLEAIFRLLQ